MDARSKVQDSCFWTRPRLGLVSPALGSRKSGPGTVAGAEKAGAEHAGTDVSRLPTARWEAWTLGARFRIAASDHERAPPV